METDITLNNLIGSELIASLQYTLASHIVVGTDYDSCKAEFEQHAEEEMKHFNMLLECAIERDRMVNSDLKSLIDNAIPVYEYMQGNSSEDLIRFHFNAEEEAISTYKKYYMDIKDDDVTLAQTIKEILQDEIEHRKDLKKIMSSIKNQDGTLDSKLDTRVDFSSLIERLRKIK